MLARWAGDIPAAFIEPRERACPTGSRLAGSAIRVRDPARWAILRRSESTYASSGILEGPPGPGCHVFSRSTNSGDFSLVLIAAISAELGSRMAGIEAALANMSGYFASTAARVILTAPLARGSAIVAAMNSGDIAASNVASIPRVAAAALPPSTGPSSDIVAWPCPMARWSEVLGSVYTSRTSPARPVQTSASGSPSRRPGSPP